MSDRWEMWEIDTTPKPIAAPEPQSFNQPKPSGRTRGRDWWTNGKVIEVDFFNWPTEDLSPCA